MRRERRRGFTLVELLVVIGIIAVLISVLLPALSKAREAANTVTCAANLRSIGQGLLLYQADNKGTFPAAYTYRPPKTWQGRPDQFINPSEGYIHWSSYIYGKSGKVTEDAFRCPSLPEGGLAPSNPASGGLDQGQVPDPDWNQVQPDAQVPRTAYTVNEAIMPRNKFNKTIRGASPDAAFQYRYVKMAMIRKGENTILATEFTPLWQVVSDVTSGDAPVVKSHRPVSGYYPLMPTGKATDLVENVQMMMGGQATHQRVGSVTNPIKNNSGVSNSLGWVGRNHGSKKRGLKGEDLRKTNFLFVDGHVETKTIEETLKPNFQWGERDTIYSLPGAKVLP